MVVPIRKWFKCPKCKRVTQREFGCTTIAFAQIQSCPKCKVLMQEISPEEADTIGVLKDAWYKLWK